MIFMADALTQATNKEIYEKTVYKPLRELLTVKITVPLGNPSFKHIHTNSFIYCDLSGYLELQNFEIIVNEIKNTTWGRHIPYEKNRWYVESCDISNDNSKYEMELELNPFPSTLQDYNENYGKYVDEYLKATNSSSSNGGTTSTGNNSVTGGEGEYIDNIVRNIVGNTTDALAKAKLIHNHIKSKQHYSKYSCSNYSSAEQCYKNITHLNCADMARLTRAMMASAGLNCYVVQNTNGVGHFWVVLEIGGQKYASDNASTATREFDYWWNPSTENTEKAVNGGKYNKTCGKNPCC